MKSYKRTGKKKRFTLKDFYPNLPEGWALYSPNEVEEKGKATPFIYTSKHFREKFLSGDESAIYIFVKNFDECFREKWTLPDGSAIDCYTNNNIERGGNGRSWVIEQIEKWKKEGTPKAKEKLKKLFKAYTDDRGRNKNKDLKEDIKIYEQIKKAVEKGKTIEEAITEGAYVQYNKRDIYYQVKKLEEERTTTERNLRFEYYLPLKGIKIPPIYEQQFKKELSLYCSVEWLRQGFISFPGIRKGLSIYPGVRPFEEERLTLKQALEKVSKKEKIKIAELNDLYAKYKKIEATYFDIARLEVLKEL